MDDYNSLINSATTVLVEFYASWCPHCQRMMPVVENIRELLGDSVPVFQFDIDESRDMADEAKVESIPTFIVYRNGEQMWRYSGEIDGNTLLQKIEQYAQ